MKRRSTILLLQACEGLHYIRIHTAAICGPYRAALLAGRNHLANAPGGGQAADAQHRLPWHQDLADAMLGEFKEWQVKFDKVVE